MCGKDQRKCPPFVGGPAPAASGHYVYSLHDALQLSAALTNESRITAIVGVFYWTILRLTEKYAANDEHLLGCLKTLGDKSRLDMLKLLKEQERSGQELARELGISQGTVSHHLNVLVRDEFILPQPRTAAPRSASIRPPSRI